jgi:hypothetical protein
MRCTFKTWSDSMLEFGAVIRKSHLAILFAAALLLTACDNQAPSTGSTTPSSAPNTTAATAKLSLQGTPPTSATVGTTFSFQPTASVTGTGITFSIQGQASWMNFNVTTGALTGTPTASDEGQTPSITISASDGGNSASIGPFSVSVQPPPVIGAGDAGLSWNAPTNNEDGSPVAGLAGYHVYYGTDPTNFGNTIDVAGSSSTTYTVTGLNSGTYYFAVAAYDANGVESAMSNIGNKTI